MDAEQETKVKKPKRGCSHCNKVFLCKACHTNGAWDHANKRASAGPPVVIDKIIYPSMVHM